MKKANYVYAEVIVSELSDAGNAVIEAAKRQSSWCKGLLTPKNGKMTVDIWEASDDHSDDILMVRVASKLTWRERCLQYGVEVLNKSEISHMGQYGFPIPTEEYLEKMEKAWDDGSLTSLMTQQLFVTRKSAEAYLEGQMTGAQVINQFGEECQRFCEEGQWELA